MLVYESASLDGPVGSMSDFTDTWPALFLDLLEVFNALQVSWEIFSLGFGSFLTGWVSYIIEEIPALMSSRQRTSRSWGHCSAIMKEVARAAIRKNRTVLNISTNYYNTDTRLHPLRGYYQCQLLLFKIGLIMGYYLSRGCRDWDWSNYCSTIIKYFNILAIE